jgi:hypothetical protein
MKKTYRSTGIVLGNLWGGGTGAYPSVGLNGDTRESLIEAATAKLVDGSLDSGMGYEKLIGAVLAIAEIETVEVDSKEYSRSEFELKFIGHLTDEQQAFLLECIDPV